MHACLSSLRQVAFVPGLPLFLNNLRRPIKTRPFLCAGVSQRQRPLRGIANHRNLYCVRFFSLKQK